MHPFTVANLRTQEQDEPNLGSTARPDESGPLPNIGLDNIRFRRGRDIVDKTNQIQELDKFQYKVKSQSTCGAYEVLSTEQGWICSCPDHRFRAVICKHIYAIVYNLKDPEKQDSRDIAEVNNEHVRVEKV